METFLAILFFPGQNMFLTFNVVVAAGLAWIYFFGVTKIKKTVIPANGVISSPAEWTSAVKSANTHSLTLSAVSISFFCLLSMYKPDQGNYDTIVIFLGGVATLTMMMAGIIQIMNKLATNTWINKQGA
jgi:hypothetical protein